MPGADVVAKRLHDVVVDLDGDVARLECSLQRGRVAARPREEDIALHPTCQARGHGVAHRQMLVRIALERRAPDLTVLVRE